MTSTESQKYNSGTTYTEFLVYSSSRISGRNSTKGQELPEEQLRDYLYGIPRLFLIEELRFGVYGIPRLKERRGFVTPLADRDLAALIFFRVFD